VGVVGSGYVGQVGDAIVVRASDDFDVVGVSVRLTDAEGHAIERGDAVETPVESGRWVYAATVAVATGTTVRIAVTVTDRPGGEAQAEEEKAV
jgi:type 1 fimbria pilin